MDVRVQGSAEALHARHHAGLSAGQALTPGPAAIPAAERAHEDGQHRATEPVVVREPVAQPVRDREHPLADGDVIDEVHRAFGHSPPPATRTDRAALAGERDQPLERTVPASDAGKAVSEHAAAEKLPELVDDEAGHATAVRRSIHSREERGEVGADDAVEHPGRRRAGDVDGSRHAFGRSGRGASQRRAVSRSPTLHAERSETFGCALCSRERWLRAGARVHPKMAAMAAFGKRRRPFRNGPRAAGGGRSGVASPSGGGSTGRFLGTFLEPCPARRDASTDGHFASGEGGIRTLGRGFAPTHA